ncbi:Hsp20/alpha crystallin family protein [Vineibacter terrae]|uniref:Hsp20/alpha crystallin family protein n=1 Tax=Vineibacter terrae TaxID=2586908 RepID=A0A5C8P8Q0_9HYPH|nr:Hsp20/alpha crystallin family protein [Vineibacter terrae]TXL70008.1 Hsp20/alpha crystallin family protein [Vineibacter terrae]
MADNATKLPIRTEGKTVEPTTPTHGWTTYENLRREIDRVFDSFHMNWRSPFGRLGFGAEPLFSRELTVAVAPAVDVVETERAYEITAELPGMDESHVEVKFAGGVLTIKGEKNEEKQKEDKDYYLSERRYGAFQRSFRVPDSVDTDKIEASFSKGVLTVTLPKTVDAQRAEKKISVTPAA